MRWLLIVVLGVAACGSGVQSSPGEACSNGVRDGSETDIDCGGACEPCALGKSCEAAAQCQSGVCDAHRCVAPIAGCTDGAKSGSETDVDCGGPGCAQCANGQTCQVQGDCKSGACIGHACSIAPAECNDGTKSGFETDTDCGGGTCPVCVNGKVCESAGDCASGTCTDHRCATPIAACLDNTTNGHETDVDCGGGTCAPCSNGRACVGPADCVSGSCTAHLCSSPGAQCLDSAKNGQETDVDCGGGTCPVCSNGKACVLAGDCASGSCVNKVCGSPPAQCLDNTKDGQETDVDCGGGTCPACVNGKACTKAGDCASGSCTNQVCTSPPAQCLDGTKNGAETDADCGGGTCPACVNGKACNGAGDCSSATCTNHVCTTPPVQCLDGAKDGAETDVDCGGGTCGPCNNGSSCLQNTDCSSGVCNASHKCGAAAACTVSCNLSGCECTSTCNGHSYWTQCFPGEGCSCVVDDGSPSNAPYSGATCTLGKVFAVYSSAPSVGCGFPGTTSGAP